MFYVCAHVHSSSLHQHNYRLIHTQGVVFATMGGLRGGVSLILAQTVLTIQAGK